MKLAGLNDIDPLNYRRQFQKQPDREDWTELM